MRSTLRVLVAAALGVLAAVLVSCGGGRGLLAGDRANALSNQLENVNGAVAANDCPSAGSDARKLAGAVRALPSSVDPRLRANLEQGAQTVAARATRACRVSTQTSTGDTTSGTGSSSTSPPATSSTASTTSTHTTTTSSSTSTTPPRTTSTHTTTSGTTPTGPSTSGGAGPGGGGTTTP